MIDNTERGIEARKLCCNELHAATELFATVASKKLAESLMFCLCATGDDSEDKYNEWMKFFGDLQAKSRILLEVLSGRAELNGESIVMTDICWDLIGSDASPDEAVAKLQETGGWCGSHVSKSA